MLPCLKGADGMPNSIDPNQISPSGHYIICKGLFVWIIKKKPGRSTAASVSAIQSDFTVHFTDTIRYDYIAPNQAVFFQPKTIDFFLFLHKTYIMGIH